MTGLVIWVGRYRHKQAFGKNLLQTLADIIRVVKI